MNKELTIARRDEEAINAATHGVGFACAIAAGIILICVTTRHGNVAQIVGSSIYATTLISAYAASTLSHLFHGPALRHAFRIADQGIIFLFIAGTFTPIAFSYLLHGAWWILTGLVWLVALAGFLEKVAFAHRVKLGAVSVGLYILLGWLPGVAVPGMIGTVPGPLLWWVLAGGLCYSGGILFFHFDHRVPYFHAAWHMMVIAGTTCHYIGILMYCTGATWSLK
jgi:hemolysin III